MNKKTSKSKVNKNEKNETVTKENIIKIFTETSIKDYSLLSEVNVLNRCIFFNADVCDYEIEKLVRYMEILEYMDDKKDITLYINSGGGDVTSCLKFYDAIRNRVKVKVNTIIEGISMSAATVMSVGATGKRYITKHSTMMFHEMSTISIGKISDEKNRLMWGEGLQDKIVSLYQEHTKIKNKEDWDKILSTDTFFDAEASLKNGFVDEIL